MTPYSEYVAAGWKLCALDRGAKGPTYANWHENPIPADAVDGLSGAGLIHSLSGTCALDVDDMTLAVPFLAEHNVDLAALLAAPDAVMISSGRKNRAKLLYRMMRPLRTLKPKGSGLELRCATAEGKSMQDALPPSIHPSGRAYEWVYGDELIGHWSQLPAISPSLLACWRALAGSEAAAETATPAPSASEKRLAELIAKQDPDAPYDEWMKVGMILHHETSGSASGFSLWNQWSRLGKKYKGAQDLRAHWHSFRSTPGKRVATAAQLEKDEPASRDEFEDVPPEVEAELAQGVTPIPKGEALQFLENRLYYVRTVERYFDSVHRNILKTDHAIQHQFCPYMTKKTDPVRLLKVSRNKKIVEALAFHPGEDVLFTFEGVQYANQFKSVAPEPIEPTAAERETIEWLFNRLPEENFRTWLLQFFGHVVQRPGTKIKSVPLVWSPIQGNGKSTLLKTIPALLVGQRYSKEVGYAQLEGRFTDVLVTAWHVNLTEFRAGTRAERNAVAAKLKPWVTDDYIGVEQKGLAAYTMPNHLVLTATSNEGDAAPIDENDRRWGVSELTAPPFTAEEKNRVFTRFLNLPRAAAVLRHFFMHMDLTGFDPTAPAPITDARTDMVVASRGSEDDLISEAMGIREDIFSRDIARMIDVQTFVKRRLGYLPTPHRIGMLLRAAGAELRRCSTPDGRDLRIWVFRDHKRWMTTSPKNLFAALDFDTVDTDDVAA